MMLFKEGWGWLKSQKCVSRKDCKGLRKKRQVLVVNNLIFAIRRRPGFAEHG
jgi:hypothetical protein